MTSTACILFMVVGGTWQSVFYDCADYVYVNTRSLPSLLKGGPCERKRQDYENAAIFRISRHTGEVAPFIVGGPDEYISLMGVNRQYIAVVFSRRPKDPDAPNDRSYVDVYNHAGTLIRRIEKGFLGLPPGDSSAYSYHKDGQIVLGDMHSSVERAIVGIGSWDEFEWAENDKAFYILKDWTCSYYDVDSEVLTPLHARYPINASPGGGYKYSEPEAEIPVPQIIYDCRNEMLYCFSSPFQGDIIGWISGGYLVIQELHVSRAPFVLLDCHTGREWHLENLPVSVTEGTVSILHCSDSVGLNTVSLSEHGIQEGRRVARLNPTQGGRVDVTPRRFSKDRLVFLSAPQVGGLETVYSWESSSPGEGGIATGGAYVREGARTIPVITRSEEDLVFTCRYTLPNGESRVYGPITVEKNVIPKNTDTNSTP